MTRYEAILYDLCVYSIDRRKNKFEVLCELGNMTRYKNVNILELAKSPFWNFFIPKEMNRENNLPDAFFGLPENIEILNLNFGIFWFFFWILAFGIFFAVLVFLNLFLS